MEKTHDTRVPYASALPYTAADGSLVRELFHPEIHGEVSTSLAEMVVAPFGESALYTHPGSHLTVHFLEGRGSMRVGARVFQTNERDTVCVPAKTAWQVQNSGDCFLRFLCFFSPFHKHSETIIVSANGKQS
ncbi:MAG: cupin domain-containing protein [Deltaproteobacteria bacterium]|nr:cupin domain-containing protein [Deltaproteobacteria bacterium]